MHVNFHLCFVLYFSQNMHSHFLIFIDQISIIFVIIVSKSQGHIKYLRLELFHFLGAVGQVGQPVAGEQVLGKPGQEWGWSRKYNFKKQRNVKSESCKWQTWGWPCLGYFPSAPTSTLLSSKLQQGCSPSQSLQSTLGFGVGSFRRLSNPRLTTSTTHTYKLVWFKWKFGFTLSPKDNCFNINLHWKCLSFWISANLSCLMDGFLIYQMPII